MNIYQTPATVRLSVQFTIAASDTPADPSTVTLMLTQPGCIEADHADAIRDGVGAYHYDLVVAHAGYWRYQWRGDGAVTVTSAVSRFRAV